MFTGGQAAAPAPSAEPHYANPNPGWGMLDDKVNESDSDDLSGLELSQFEGGKGGNYEAWGSPAAQAAQAAPSENIYDHLQGSQQEPEQEHIYNRLQRPTEAPQGGNYESMVGFNQPEAPQGGNYESMVGFNQPAVDPWADGWLERANAAGDNKRRKAPTRR